MTSKPKGTVKRAAKTCNLFCNIAAKRMLRVLAPTFKPVLQHIKVAASCVNTDFWLDKITREFSLYTGVTSLAAKQVCHVATRSTVPLCHLWPVAPVSRPCVPCGPSCPLCPLWLLWTVWTLWALCSMLPLCRSFPWWPLCPPVPLVAPMALVFVVSPVVPVSSVSVVAPVAPVPLERATLAKPAKTRYKFSEWPPNHQKPEKGFEKFYINSCTSLIATELDLSEEITDK